MKALYLLDHSVKPDLANLSKDIYQSKLKLPGFLGVSTQQIDLAKEF